MKTATLLLLAVIAVSAQEKTPRKLIASLEGRDLYKAYCASCHGLNAKGKGPVAAVIKTGVPDLTITKRPIAELEAQILGDVPFPAAHGSREMPVWGPVFRRVENDQDLGLVRVRRVIEYVQSLRTK
ncbi:MAG: cytochrome c [Acidobacteria bacterium]|nr:cytochrome c [Acidobacteriota bacterium]